MNRGKRSAKAALALTAVAVALGAAGNAQAPVNAPGLAAEPAIGGGQTVARRLSEAQYVRSIHDTFGADIKVPGRFDPPLRVDGLLAIGDGKAGISSSAFEQYELRARGIAAQVLGSPQRPASLPCQPGPRFDRDCAKAFLGETGRQLFRRPLSAAELDASLALAESVTSRSGSMAKGLEMALARLLVSPAFVFRLETSEPAGAAGVRQLDDWSAASRISFLLWDAPPDRRLLDAVASGAMRDPARLAAEVDRMIASPRYVEGVRAFFSDMFAFDQFTNLSKDQAIYPKYTSQLAVDAREQALRTLVNLLVTRRGDYRDIFLTRETFLNRNLAALYRVPISGDGMSGWIPYTFAEDDRRGGILSLAAFLMLDPTHEGRSSPTIRGKSVRELFLCQPVPPPPPNVNFNIVQNTSDPLHRTARERLRLHAEDPSCAGCHKITDPIGLSMENYDAIGAWRSHENGALIDASGSLGGKTYADLAGLSRVIHDGDDAASCVVQRVFEYGTGQTLKDENTSWMNWANVWFARSGYKLPELMRMMALSPALKTVAAPSEPKRQAGLQPAMSGAGR